MPVHDWTKVDAGCFHDFHTMWFGMREGAVNRVTPSGPYTRPHGATFGPASHSVGMDHAGSPSNQNDEPNAPPAEETR